MEMFSKQFNHFKPQSFTGNTTRSYSPARVSYCVLTYRLTQGPITA